MKSVLVTGASGFVGRHTLIPLVEKDFKVHALFSTEKPDIKLPSVSWHQINLHEKKSVDDLFSQLQPSHLLHLAWYAKPKVYWTSPLNLEWLNSSLYLLKKFGESGGKRALLVGSCAEYDWQHHYCKEYHTPCIPETLYGRSKYALHLLSETLAEQNNFSLAWGRLFFLFGTHESPERLVSSAICTFLKRKNFKLMSGSQIRDLMYVEDVADALATLLDSEVTGPVNIASGIPVTLRTLISQIANKLDAVDLIEDEINLHSSPLLADVTRLMKEVKWQPRYSLDTALDKTIAWWDAQS